MKRLLWVVEVWDDVLGWRPACETGITRRMGRSRLRVWKRKYHERTDRFRLVKYVPANATNQTSAVPLKANGQPVGTFLVTIDDGFVEYTYPLRPRSKHWSIHKIYTKICKAFRVREEQGAIRKPNQCYADNQR